ncbi:MAG: PFL family protein [Eubacteriaceae bacterium]|nr:PFL family protein [Eubacteriaceae bacterium]
MLVNTDVLETIRMLEKEKLDVRTITMGISLLDCLSDNADATASRIYNKICNTANALVATGEDIEREFGVPIINKRVAVTPVSLAAFNKTQEYIKIAESLDKAANEIGINFIGGYSALVQKGISATDKVFIDSIPEALALTGKVCSSVNVATTKAGINFDAVGLMGTTIKSLAYETRHADSIGCAKFVVFANAVSDNPFMAGAFHGIEEGETVINVGVSGPGAVLAAISKLQGEPIDVVCETIKKTAFKITRAGQLVGNEASRRLGVPFGILDLSLAPTPEISDSVADILEAIGVGKTGAHGTTAALALLTDAVKKGGIMASSNVGGMSGAFIPVSEDAGMISAVKAGALTIDKLEAMTSVCSVGIDMIAVPGDTPAETLSALIADEMAIGVVNSKTTAVRAIPVYGKKVGEMAVFGGLLGEAPIMPLNSNSSVDFIRRGGRIPAPLHSFRN